ncbi:MAG: hypothetical protein JXR03_08020 [Cyclobacteriaceae bacterium]
MRAYRLVFLFLISLAACKPTKVATDSGNAYEEDLSYLRPDISSIDVKPESQLDSARLVTTNVDPEYDIKASLDSLNLIIIERNKSVNYVDGYTIQVYTGNDRTLATETLDAVNEYDDSLNPEISYYQPTFKVKVGHYTNKLQAHKVYETLKPHFPRALLVPERIKVNYE